MTRLDFKSSLCFSHNIIAFKMANNSAKLMVCAPNACQNSNCKFLCLTKTPHPAFHLIWYTLHLYKYKYHHWKFVINH